MFGDRLVACCLRSSFFFTVGFGKTKRKRVGNPATVGEVLLEDEGGGLEEVFDRFVLDIREDDLGISLERESELEDSADAESAEEVEVATELFHDLNKR